jgi:hypothetical protein
LELVPIAYRGDVKMLKRLKIPVKLKMPDAFGAPTVGVDIDRGAIKSVQVSQSVGDYTR